MIQSKHRTLGFWLLAGVIAFFIFLTICCITQYYFHLTIIKIDIHNQSFNGQVITNLIACLIFIAILSCRASLIEISSGDIIKTISFKNLFTRQAKTYSFQEFDGYFSTRLWHKQFNENKTLCLIKEGRVVKKIDNFFYSNVDQLQTGLEGIPYLGFKSMDIVTSWKVLFNQPIIKS
jgi:hypothetical protein